MRRIRIIASITLVLIAAFSAGCLNKTWLYDFTDPSALISDWHTSDMPTFTLDGTGLNIKDSSICSLVSFTGDLTTTVYFDYSVSGECQSSIGFGFSSAVFGEESSIMELNFQNPGSAGDTYSEGWSYISMGPKGYCIDLSTELISGFIIDGINQVELALKGDKLKVSVNGKELHTGNAANFERVSSHFILWGDMEEEATMVVKRVEIKYAGELIENYPDL